MVVCVVVEVATAARPSTPTSVALCRKAAARTLGTAPRSRTSRDMGTRWRLRTALPQRGPVQDRKSTRLNSSHANISYAVFCLKKQHYFPPIFFPFRFPSHFFLLYSKPSSFPSFITTFSLFFFPFFLFPHPLHVMFYIPIIISY